MKKEKNEKVNLPTCSRAKVLTDVLKLNEKVRAHRTINEYSTLIVICENCRDLVSL